MKAGQQTSPRRSKPGRPWWPRARWRKRWSRRSDSNGRPAHYEMATRVRNNGHLASRHGRRRHRDAARTARRPYAPLPPGLAAARGSGYAPSGWLEPCLECRRFSSEACSCGGKCPLVPPPPRVLGLEPRQTSALEGALRTHDRERAAEASGCSARAIRRWPRVPAFAPALAESRRECHAPPMRPNVSQRECVASPTGG